MEDNHNFLFFLLEDDLNILVNERWHQIFVQMEDDLQYVFVNGKQPELLKQGRRSQIFKLGRQPQIV